MNNMNHWRDRVFFSVLHDCKISRISGYDEKGNEFFTEIEFDKNYRSNRKEAILRIQEYMEEVDSNDQPVNNPGRID